MAEIGGQPGQESSDVRAGALPSEQRRDGETMAEIMNPRTVRCSGSDAGGVEQAPEGFPEIGR